MKSILVGGVLILTATLAAEQLVDQAEVKIVNNTSVTIQVTLDHNGPACAQSQIWAGDSCTTYVSAPADHSFTATAPGYAPMTKTHHFEVNDHKVITFGDAN